MSYDYHSARPTTHHDDVSRPKSVMRNWQSTSTLPAVKMHQNRKLRLAVPIVRDLDVVTATTIEFAWDINWQSAVCVFYAKAEVEKRVSSKVMNFIFTR